MPAPTTIAFYPGANGTPTDDTSAIGGAITTGGGELNENTANLLIDTVSIPASSGSDEDYYGIAYRKNEASGHLQDAYFDNRTAMIGNASASVASVVSTSATDTGTVKLTGYVSSSFVQESITATGTTSATGTTTWDASGIWRAEYLVGGAPATPYGDITITIDGQIVAVIYGDRSLPSTYRGNVMATREFQIAVASAKDTTISSANRLTPPSGISSFAQGARWTGLDQSIAVPGTDLDGGEYVGFCIKLTVKAGIPAPVGGYVLPDVGIRGSAVAS